MLLQLHLCKGPLLCLVQCTEDLRERDVALGCDFSGTTRSRITPSIHAEHCPPLALFSTAGEVMNTYLYLPRETSQVQEGRLGVQMHGTWAEGADDLTG